LGALVGAVVEEAKHPLDNDEKEEQDSDDLMGVVEVFALFCG
jgi:hypothetical protein